MGRIERARRRQERRRHRGERLVRIWIPDTDTPGFAEEARRQSESVRNSGDEADVMAWLGGMTSGAPIDRIENIRASFEDRARAEAERRFRGPRMFVGTTVDREIAAGVAMAVWAREQEPDCRCEPCPGRGNDGHGMTHCAECCFGSGVIAEIDCPIHGEQAITGQPTDAQIEAAPRIEEFDLDYLLAMIKSYPVIAQFDLNDAVANILAGGTAANFRSQLLAAARRIIAAKNLRAMHESHLRPSTRGEPAETREPTEAQVEAAARQG